MKIFNFKKESGNVASNTGNCIAATSNEQKIAYKPDYKKTFFKKANHRAKSGKTMYICPKQHELFQRLVLFVGNGECSLHSYIFNVLQHHIEMYREEMKHGIAENSNIF